MFLTLLWVLSCLGGTLLRAQTAPATAAGALLPDAAGRTVYHFPPPLDGPEFPFSIVTLDESTPDWALLLYEADLDLNLVQERYAD